MLKICTVFFKGFYPSSYVARLYDSLKKHTTLDFEFICLSDDPNVKADVILPYNHHSNIQKHWHKLKFFSPQFAYQNRDDYIVVMDIDQVIVQNIDELLATRVMRNQLVTYGQWW